MNPEQIKKPQPAPKNDAERSSLGKTLREIGDEIVFVFAVFLFINIFIAEHYKIPTGSMTPTLLGGEIADVDVNGDEKNDIVYFMRPGEPLVFVRDGKRFIRDRTIGIDGDMVAHWKRTGRISTQNSRILVNKMAYWFGSPKRGDIAIFKVPPFLFKPEESIYIKRVGGESGDRLSFDDEGHLVANGKTVGNPDFYRDQVYEPDIERVDYSRNVPEIQYVELSRYQRHIVSIDVPKDEIYMFGDNASGSLDSRYWGGVPLENFKGKAFVHFWPLRLFAWL